MADSRAELLIRINADAKNAKKAFEDLRAQTEDLESELKGVALVSAAAFAAFSATIYLSVQSFQEAQQAANELTLALQNQGIYTDELRKSYDEYADAVSAKTGIDDDAITKAQAVAQVYLKQIPVTQELTQAIADLGTQMGGDLSGAAEKIARTIGTSTNAFARQGLVIGENLTTAERYAKVLEFVQMRAGGMGEEFNKANGYTLALNSAFGNFVENIGSKFFPIFSKAREIAAAFFNIINKSELVTQLAVTFLAVGTVLTGVVAGVTALAAGFLVLKAAALSFGVTTLAAFAPILIPIGLITAAVVLLALNWDRVVATIAAGCALIVESFRQIVDVAKGVGLVFKGIFTLDPSEVDKGVTKVYEAMKKVKDHTVSTYKEIYAERTADEVKQNEEKLKLAAEEADRTKAHERRLGEIRKGEIDLLKLQNENASAEIIGLKTKELEVLKALDEEKSAGEIAQLQIRLQSIRELQAEAQMEEKERKTEFENAKKEMDAEFAELGIADAATLKEAKLAELQATAKTESDIERQLQEDILKTKIEARNKELLDKKKYGVAYAAINKALYSDEVQGTKNAANELVALQQSKNSTLKAIGKAAAVASITIATAESAMNIYKGFSTIPIIGPALGIAGAAAAVAFGGERIGAVVSAADGGLITGGVTGKDSVPAMLMPGELVVPKQNFEEVVGAVRGESGGQAEVVAALDRMEAKLSTPQTTIIQGDVTADDSYVESLIRRINDAVEFRNAKLIAS